MDIYIWISCSRLDVDIPFCIRKYPHEFIDIHGYIHLDNLFKMWISINGYRYPYCNYDKTDVLGKYLHKPIYMYGYIHRYPHIYLYIMDIHVDIYIWISI